jgi:secondary thiamine-phosphate synthase enzyme
MLLNGFNLLLSKFSGFTGCDDILFKEITVKSSRRVEFINITDQLKKEVNEVGINGGIIIVYIPHTTAAITINEGSDPDVKADIIEQLNKIIPYNGNYRHLEGNSHAHIKSSLIGNSETIIIDKGRLQLGSWQSVYFCEFDGPRSRRVYIKIIADE